MINVVLYVYLQNKDSVDTKFVKCTQIEEANQIFNKKIIQVFE